MEEIVRFDGDLNLSQANLPEGDYADARNIFIGEDDNGNSGVIKKLRDIDEFVDLNQTIIASTSDPDGNQYFLTSGEDLLYRNVTSVASIGSFSVGDSVSQTNGYVGIVAEVGSSSLKIIDLTATSYSQPLPLYIGRTPSGTEYSSGASSSIRKLDSYATLVKVDTDGNITNLLTYNCALEGGGSPDLPTIEDPTLKKVGGVLIWNYFDEGVPLSWYEDRTYELVPERENYIQLIKTPPSDIILAANTATSGSVSVFSENTITFAARYVYDSGEVSALSGYKTFIANPDRSDLNNGLDPVDFVRISSTRDHPKYVSEIEFYARVGDGAFRRIDTSNIERTEAFTVSVDFEGQLSESLSQEESSKNFDAVPLTAEAVESIGNRIFLGNITEDLPNEDAEASISATGNDNSEYTQGSSPSTIDKPFYYQSDADSGLVIDTVNGSPFVSNRFVLSNDSTYNLGIAFYDEFFRTRGVVKNSVTSFKTGLFDAPNRISSMVITASTIPSWAKYYKVLATRNLSKDFSIEGYASAIFYRLEDGDGSLYFSNFVPDDSTIESIIIEPELSYTFQDGDRLNLQLEDEIFNLKIKAVIDGRIYCDPKEGFGLPYLDTSDKYFEIYSPKDITNEDSTLFYETGIQGETADIGSGVTISDPEIYDQTLIKEKIRTPIYSQAIDSSLEYHFLGDPDPRSQEGLPVSISGGLLYMSDDATDPFDTISSVGQVQWNALHTNDARELPIGTYQILDTGHGLSVGDIYDNTFSGSTSKYKVISVIDNDRFYAYGGIVTVSISDTSGFTAGEDIVLSTSEGTISGVLLDIVTNVNVSIGNVSWNDIQTLEAQGADSISNGTANESVSSVDANTLYEPTVTDQNVNVTAIKVMYSNDKVYVGQGNLLLRGADFPWDEAQSHPATSTTPAIRYDLDRDSNANVISFPAKSGKAKLHYSLQIENLSSTDSLSFFLSSVNEGTENIGGTILPSTSSTVTGSLEIDLSPSVIIEYALKFSGTSPNLRLLKGSYMYGVISDEESDGIVDFEGSNTYVLSRKPNRREDDDFTYDLIQGKPLIVDRGISTPNLSTKFRWGGKYIQDSIISPISSFNAVDSDNVPEESGAITQLLRTSKLDSVGTVLAAICKREVNSIYVGERLVTNNDGSTSLAVSDSVVGSIQPLRGSRGSSHRSSIAKDQDGNFVFWDNFNKDICRYSREGIVPISDYKVKPFFEDKSGEFNAFYDKFYNTFFLYNPTSDETISYSQDLRWVGFHDFSFDLGGEQIDERSFPISGTKVYTTREGNNYGTYIGQTPSSYITLSKFNPQNIEPRFIRMRGSLFNTSTRVVKDVQIIFSNDNDQQTTLDQDFFEIEGSYIYSDIYLDQNNGGISDGIPLLGSNLDIKITLNTDTSDSHLLKEVYLGFDVPTY